MKHTNLDINDTACLYVVHILQHPTSRPSTKSTQNTMVNAPRKNLLPLPAGKYGKSTKHSTRRRHQVNDGMSGLDTEMVLALRALRSFRSKMKVAAKRRHKTHISSNKEMEKWIEENVARETNVARKRVEDADTAIKQAQEEMRNAENVGLTPTKPETTFEEMLIAIRDSLSDLATSDDREDEEDKDDDEYNSELGNLSEDDDPGWVMGKIPKTVQHCMERFRQKQKKLDELTEPGWGDVADYFPERDERSGSTALTVPAVVQS